jgi:hypothetical protein
MRQMLMLNFQKNHNNIKTHYQSSTYNTQQRHLASQNQQYHIVFSLFNGIT